MKKPMRFLSSVFAVVAFCHGASAQVPTGGLKLWLKADAISGLVAILLMLVHATWATVVLLRRDEAWIVKFHRFSLFVWLVWLVPYFSPMVLGMTA